MVGWHGSVADTPLSREVRYHLVPELGSIVRGQALKRASPRDD